MKTVFVTGASGLLGTNLVHLLTERGYFVKGLVREKSRYKGIRHPNLQLLEGGLFDDLTKVLTDVDYIVHIAAVTSQHLIDYADYWKVNGHATIQLFHAAVKCKVKKFLFISTANTLGHGTLAVPGNEHEPAMEPFSASLYARSKKMAEDYLFSQKEKMDVVIVNPTFMLGAYDTKPSSGRIILMAWKKKVIFCPPGGKNFVHVEDVAEGIIKCIEKGRSGEKYLLANENMSYKDFFQKVNKLTGYKTLMVRMPETVLNMLGALGELLRRLGIKTSVGLVNMRILCAGNYFSNAKSVSELGLTYRPVDQAIADAVNYFETCQGSKGRRSKVKGQRSKVKSRR
jgi:dihydroflavonol-4-reductase